MIIGKYNYFLHMSTSENTILGLKLPTDPRWVDLASISLEAILSDHAYCEQKAASSCISLIQKYSEHTRLVEELSPIVTEEWGHFRMVLAELKKRKLKLGKQRKDEYVHGLMSFERKSGSPQERLLDKLLMMAMIEARSCERFRLLSEGLEEPRMKDFYKKFMISEAGHYRLFLDLAKEYIDEKIVILRWKEWLKFEKELLSGMEVRGDRMH